MSIEYNKTIVRRFYEEGFNKGDLASARELIASNYVSHNPIIGDLLPGVEGYKQLIAVHRHAFPDIRVKIEDMIANVDRVVVRWTWRGTHRGPFMGVAPTGNGRRCRSASPSTSWTSASCPTWASRWPSSIRHRWSSHPSGRGWSCQPPHCAATVAGTSCS